MRKTLMIAAITCFGALPGWANNAPYAGQETRDIASLSAQDIEDLRAGRGGGFALSAELNGYPGPAHILELADTLDLTPDQIAQVQAIFDRMTAQARTLGAEFIDAEAALDAAFADQTMSAARLAALTAEAGRLRGALRAVHLAAHLEAAPVLSRHQTMLYNRARGYAGDAHGGHSGH